MSIGPATIVAIMASALATLGYVICSRLVATRQWVAMFVFGVLLALVLAVGPLIKLP